MLKQYHSFEEIDQDLRILSLQRKIDRENLKWHLRMFKQDLNGANLFDEFKSLLREKLIVVITKSFLKLLKKEP